MTSIDLSKNKIFNQKTFNKTLYNKIFSSCKSFLLHNLNPVGEYSYEHLEEQEYGHICARCGKEIKYKPWEDNGSLCQECFKDIKPKNEQFKCFKNSVMRNKSDEILLL